MIHDQSKIMQQLTDIKELLVTLLFESDPFLLHKRWLILLRVVWTEKIFLVNLDWCKTL